MRFQSITVIGLGLIGGSLAGASRKAFPRAKIFGVTRNQRALRKSKSIGWIDKGFRDVTEWGASARAMPESSLQLVILCTPVDTLKDFLKKIDRVAPTGTVVTDAGSVKGFLVRWADRQRWRHIHFVGAHPMAGSHERGIGAARADLFKQAITFVTPGKASSNAVIQFWKKISRQVVILSPGEHDRITAEVSHLPHLIAALLVNGTSPEALCCAASGFLDTTRVAQGNPALWVPIFLENQKELCRSAERFARDLKRIKEILKKGDPAKLKPVLAQSQKRRAALE